MNQRTRAWRRRLALGLAVGAAGYLIAQHLGEQPVSVDVRYHFGETSPYLSSAHVRYTRGGDPVAHVQFNYQRRRAPADQGHDVALRRGDHDITVELRCRDGRNTRVRRLLPVRGPGLAHVYLDRAATACAPGTPR